MSLCAQEQQEEGKVYTEQRGRDRVSIIITSSHNLADCYSTDFTATWRHFWKNSEKYGEKMNFIQEHIQFISEGQCFRYVMSWNCEFKARQPARRTYNWSHWNERQ